MEDQRLTAEMEEKLSARPLRLNLGSCETKLTGFVSVDRCPPAEVIWDLSVAPWPWDDNSVTEILASDVVEHLPDRIQTMNELHRVLAPGGRVRIVVPSTRGAGAWCDPTHVSYWNAAFFEYFEKGNFARERFRNHYGITADFKILSLEHTRYMIHRFGEEVWKVDVWLEAVK